MTSVSLSLLDTIKYNSSEKREAERLMYNAGITMSIKEKRCIK